MITIKSLTVSYKKGNKIIDALDLTLEENSINGIVGLNGAGKTTFLNSIYGLKKSDSGNVNLNNRRLSKKDIAYLVTENFFYSNITGREYLSLFKNDSFDIEKWNQLFKLPIDEIVDGYSTGQKKKLALIGVLKQDKPILILDEPFNGLDIESCRAIHTLLLHLKKKGKTIIITSHILETLTNLCDYIHYLEEGKIKYSKPKSDFEAFEKELLEIIDEKSSSALSELI